MTTHQWSDPRSVNTRNGARTVRSLNLDPDSPEWLAWRHDKERVKAARFSLGREYQGTGWQLTHWQAEAGQFEADLETLTAILAEAGEVEAASKEAMKIDFVAADYAPLTTASAARLYEWQRPSCQRVIAALKAGNALDASQTGAGKTFVALAACAELGLTPFVVAPLAVLESWRRASKFMGVPLGGVVNYDKARNGSAFIARNDSADPAKGERTFAFAPQQPKGELFGNAPASEFKPLLILDECQKVKSGKNSLQGQMAADIALQGAKTLYVSATAAKDPTEMYSLGLALGLHEGGESYFAWAKAHGCRSRNGRGLKFTDNPRAAADIMGRIHRTLFPAHGTRIRAADVPGYPDNAVTAHLVSEGSIVDAYRAMNEKLDGIEADIAAGKLEKNEAAAMGLAAITLARRASEKGKLQWMADEVRELVADGFQVVVFLNFREHLAILRDDLKLKTEPVWGTAWLGKELVFDERGNARYVDIDGPAQKPEARQKIIDDFQTGKTKVILVSLAAGGAGISLHDDRGIAPRQSLVSPSYSAIDLVQAIGRIWRAGSHSKATQRVIYAAGTIEEEIAASVTAKIANIETLNDGDILPDCLARFTQATGGEIH